MKSFISNVFVKFSRKEKPHISGEVAEFFKDFPTAREKIFIADRAQFTSGSKAAQQLKLVIEKQPVSLNKEKREKSRAFYL